jgi:hypothetical protein
MPHLGGGSREGTKHSSHPLARLVGSSSSALFELIIFHPIDTAAKRIITHQGRLLTAEGLSLSSKFSKMGAVVFQVCVYVRVRVGIFKPDRSIVPFGEGRGEPEVNILFTHRHTYLRLLLTSCNNTHAHIYIYTHTQDKIRAGPFQKLRSLFPGIKFGAYYKLCQRTGAYGLQPFLFDHVHRNYHEGFTQWVGSKRARNVEFATAAAITGTAEVVFLPLDTLKILAQTNPDRCVFICVYMYVCVCVCVCVVLPRSFAHLYIFVYTYTYTYTHTHTHTNSLRGRSFFQVVQQEGLRLYRGAGWTMARNFPGSFCLFGGSALVKEKVFHLEQYSDATVMQELVASTTVRLCVCVWVCVCIYIFFETLAITSPPSHQTHTHTHTHTHRAPSGV